MTLLCLPSPGRKNLSLASVLTSSSFSSFSISSLEYSRILDRFVFRGLPFDLSEQHLTSMFTISWKVRLSIFLWSKWRRSQSPKCLFKHVSWFPFSRNSPCNHKSSIFFLWSDSFWSYPHMTLEMFDPQGGWRPMQPPVKEGKKNPKENKKKPKVRH